jgi:NAD+ synthase
MPLRPKFREEMVSIVITFIRDSLEQSGMNGVVIGMSGGLDSSILAKLASDALGPDKVLGMFLPESSSSKEDAEHAEFYARSLEIEFETVSIDGMLQASREAVGSSSDKAVLANIKARCRMIVLYQRANSLNRLVLGTGNKSELMVGYFTKFGDGGCDLLPIGDLYKTQIKEMAEFLELPKEIIITPRDRTEHGRWPDLGKDKSPGLGGSQDKVDGQTNRPQEEDPTDTQDWHQDHWIGLARIGASRCSMKLFRRSMNLCRSSTSIITSSATLPSAKAKRLGSFSFMFTSPNLEPATKIFLYVIENLTPTLLGSSVVLTDSISFTGIVVLKYQPCLSISSSGVSEWEVRKGDMVETTTYIPIKVRIIAE